MKESVPSFSHWYRHLRFHTTRQMEGCITRLFQAEMSLIHVLSRQDIIASCVLMYRLLLLHVIWPVVGYSPAAHHSRSLQSARLREIERECVLLESLINLSALISLYPTGRSQCCGPAHST